MPDGSVQQRSATTSLPAGVETTTIDRQRLTIDSDDFTTLLRERQLDTPPYTLILTPSGQGVVAWIAVSADGQPLLTVNAETGEVVP